MDSSLSPLWQRVLIVLLFFMTGYIGGYAALRWGNVLSRHTYCSFINGLESFIFIDRVGRRDTVAPRATNVLIEVVNGLYTPLIRSEEWYWNSASKGHWG